MSQMRSVQNKNFDETLLTRPIPPPRPVQTLSSNSLDIPIEDRIDKRTPDLPRKASQKGFLSGLISAKLNQNNSNDNGMYLEPESKNPNSLDLPPRNSVLISPALPPRNPIGVSPSLPPKSLKTSNKSSDSSEEEDYIIPERREEVPNKFEDVETSSTELDEEEILKLKQKLEKAERKKKLKLVHKIEKASSSSSSSEEKNLDEIDSIAQLKTSSNQEIVSVSRRESSDDENEGNYLDLEVQVQVNEVQEKDAKFDDRQMKRELEQVHKVQKETPISSLSSSSLSSSLSSSSSSLEVDNEQDLLKKKLDVNVDTSSDSSDSSNEDLNFKDTKTETKVKIVESSDSSETTESSSGESSEEKLYKKTKTIETSSSELSSSSSNEPNDHETLVTDLLQMWKDKSGPILEKDEKFHCSDCPFKSTKKEKFRIHSTLCHPNKDKFKCELCQFATNSESILKKHQTNSHEIDSETSSESSVETSSESFHV